MSELRDVLAPQSGDVSPFFVLCGGVVGKDEVNVKHAWREERNR